MRQYVQAGEVPFQCVNPVQKQSDWVCTAMPGTMTRPPPEVAGCAISTGWCACTAFTDPVNPRLPRAELLGHLCASCTDTSVSAVFWEEWHSHCSLGGERRINLSPGESSNLLPFSFPMLSQWGASIFLFLLLEECTAMLRSSQPVVQNRWNYKHLLSRTEKGKRQKEARAGECQAQWGPGKFPSSFLQFVKSLVDFSTTHSLYLINNT